MEKEKEAFLKIQKKFQFKEAEFSRAIKTGDLTVIACKGKIGSIIGKKGMIVGELSKELNSKVRIVEDKNEKKIIEDLIGGARLVGINELYKPEGKEFKILVNGRDKNRLSSEPEQLEEAIEELTQIKTKIEFRQ